MRSHLKEYLIKVLPTTQQEAWDIKKQRCVAHRAKSSVALRLFFHQKAFHIRVDYNADLWYIIMKAMQGSEVKRSQITVN